MAKAFKRKGDRFVARLDRLEREVVAGLLEQTREFLAPAPRAETGDPFDDLVASMGMPSLPGRPPTPGWRARATPRWSGCCRRPTARTRPSRPSSAG